MLVGPPGGAGDHASKPPGWAASAPSEADPSIWIQANAAWRLHESKCSTRLRGWVLLLITKSSGDRCGINLEV